MTVFCRVFLKINDSVDKNVGRASRPRREAILDQGRNSQSDSKTSLLSRIGTIGIAIALLSNSYQYNTFIYIASFLQQKKKKNRAINITLFLKRYLVLS